MLIELIEIFEWSWGDNSVKESEVKLALMESGFALDNSAAQALFERLFFYVFKKLTEKGQKRLSTVELTDQLAQPPLSGTDQQIFLILGVTRSISERVGVLEQQTSEERELLASLGAQVGAFDVPSRRRSEAMKAAQLSLLDWLEKLRNDQLEAKVRRGIQKCLLALETCNCFATR